MRAAMSLARTWQGRGKEAGRVRAEGTEADLPKSLAVRLLRAGRRLGLYACPPDGATSRETPAILSRRVTEGEPAAAFEVILTREMEARLHYEDAGLVYVWHNPGRQPGRSELVIPDLLPGPVLGADQGAPGELRRGRKSPASCEGGQYFKGRDLRHGRRYGQQPCALDLSGCAAALLCLYGRKKADAAFPNAGREAAGEQDEEKE